MHITDTMYVHVHVHTYHQTEIYFKFADHNFEINM